MGGRQYWLGARWRRCRGGCDGRSRLPRRVTPRELDDSPDDQGQQDGDEYPPADQRDRSAPARDGLLKLRLLDERVPAIAVTRRVVPCHGR